jgi:hypothetical protein
MEHSIAALSIRSPAMKGLVTELHNIKYVVSIAGVLIAFLFDKNLGPAEDDLPLRFKIILAAPVTVAVYYAQIIEAEHRPIVVLYAFGLLIISIIVYMSIWSIFGYMKVIAVPRQWWKPCGAAYTYPEMRVMGGGLTPDAKHTVDNNNISVQEYFEGTAYNQDLVWKRGWRVFLQVILVLTYVSVAFFYTGTIVLAVM